MDATSLSSSMPQLCFSRADLTRSDFNVERMVNTVRRRATLEQMQSDLRLYLKILQNSMIELINDDYADFVTLSSNLVNLRATVDKLSADLDQISSEFVGNTVNLSSAVDAIRVETDALIANRSSQLMLQHLIAVHVQLQRFKSILCDAQSTFDPILFDRLIESMCTINLLCKRLRDIGSLDDATNRSLLCARDECINGLQILLDAHLIVACNSDNAANLLLLLAGYDACDRRDAATALVIAELIDTPITRCLGSGSLVDDLCAILAMLRRQRDEFIGRLKTTTITVGSLATSIDAGIRFVDQCLLTELLSVLERYFTTVLIPTDVDIFHGCYTALTEFVRNWPAPDSDNNNRCDTLLKLAVDKFNCVVYFKLQTIQIQSSISNCFESDRFDDGEKSGGQFHLAASIALFDAISNVWSERVYLPVLAHKLWDFTLKLLKRYIGWIDSTNKRLSSPTLKKNTAVTNGETDNKKVSDVTDENGLKQNDNSWHSLLLLMIDSNTFGSALLQLAYDVIWPQLRRTGCDNITSYSRCLSTFEIELKERYSKCATSICDRISVRMSTQLENVVQVPRQYRWTRKAAPTIASDYIRSAFDDVEQLAETTTKLFLSTESRTQLIASIVNAVQPEFLGNVRQVLHSVDRTSSSLNRLKKTTTTAAKSGGDQMSDDDKIRHQLYLDLVEFRERATTISTDAHIDWTALDELRHTAALQHAGATVDEA